MAETVSVDASLLESLKQIIERQQEQIKEQAETMEALKSRVEQLETTSARTQDLASEAQSTAEQAIVTMQEAAPGRESSKNVSSGSEKVKLAISGHVNRAVNVLSDGNETEAFFVDNDVSNTRFRFVGTGQVSEDTVLGTRIELAVSPNNSFDVSQDNETADDFIDLRKAEVSLRNDDYGQLLFGKGQAAADDTAEHDLSLVAGPIMYSGVSDIVGGIQFFDGALTGLTVGDAFFNFDGNRQDRVRYDSPVLGPGVQASLSAGSDQRYDAALTWGGDYGDWSGVDIGPFTTLGAVSVRDPDVSDVDYRLAGSFSALHNPTGVSLTFSAGMDSLDSGDDPFNLYGKLAWDTLFFSFGPTGFGVDATYTENVSGEGDEGYSLGIAAVQLIEDFGTEAYLQVRYFELDRAAAPDPDGIVVGTVGTRVKF